MLKRFTHVCFRRRRRVLLVWVLGIVLIGAISGAVGSNYRSDFTLPDVESKRGIDLLDAEFGGQGAGQVGNIVFQAEQGVDDPAVKEAMTAFLAKVATFKNIQSVTSPYEPGNEAQIFRTERHPTFRADHLPKALSVFIRITPANLSVNLGKPFGFDFGRPLAAAFRSFCHRTVRHRIRSTSRCRSNAHKQFDYVRNITRIIFDVK